MKYILFGTGDYYNRFRHWFTDRDVVAILDNDKSKQGMSLDGHPVISPDKVLEHSFDAIVVLSFYIKEIKRQLLDLGVFEDKIYHFYDIHDLFSRESSTVRSASNNLSASPKSILLLSHDLSLGGPALALLHGAITLKKAGYDVSFASMIDGDLRFKAEDASIPVIVDRRLQLGTMNELAWTHRYDMIICNTINYHIFLSDRDSSIPVIWWLHDSAFFYDGIKESKLKGIDDTNLKLVSVGAVPRNAMQRYKPEASIEDLIYGVSNDI